MSTVPAGTASAGAVAPASTPALTLDRRTPPLGGFSLTYVRIELMRRLRNRRTILFTLAFPVVMYFIVGARLVSEPLTDVPLAQGGVSVAAYIMEPHAPAARHGDGGFGGGCSGGRGAVGDRAHASTPARSREAPARSPAAAPAAAAPRRPRSARARR